MVAKYHLVQLTGMVSMGNWRLSPATAVLGIRTFFKWLLAGIWWTVLTVGLWVMSLPIVVDEVALGPRFRWAMWGTATVAICLSLSLLTAARPASRWVNTRFGNYRISRRFRPGDRALAGLVLLALVSLPAVWLIWLRIDQSRTAADADAAEANFHVHHAGGADQSRLNQTLAEFERARRSLVRVWQIPADSTPITLWLYESIEGYHSVTGLYRSAGAASCEPTGPVVWAPLEQAPELPGEDDHTLTPLHEMVHATMCQYLGAGRYHATPRWFHEGIAELYENDARHLKATRTINRLYVWLHGDILMPPPFFCTEPLNRNGFEFRLFYRTALEFTRSLEAKHGRDSLLGVVDDVQGGIPFEKSLQDRFGATCVELYGNWLESW